MIATKLLTLPTPALFILYKLPFMKAFFRGEVGQLFEAVFPPPPSSLRWHSPYDPSPPFHVARGVASTLRWQSPETPNGVSKGVSPLAALRT